VELAEKLRFSRVLPFYYRGTSVFDMFRIEGVSPTILGYRSEYFSASLRSIPRFRLVPLDGILMFWMFPMFWSSKIAEDGLRYRLKVLARYAPDHFLAFASSKFHTVGKLPYASEASSTFPIIITQ
jgi:hypothetical protein